jgi:small conductance mechanosensitive channel
MEDLIGKLKELAMLYGLQILAALAIFIIGRWIAKGLRSVFRRLLQRAEVEPTISSFISNFAYYALLVFVILAALSRLGIQTASIIAVIGAAGLAVGLALQGSLANFAAGLLIILFRPFQVGHYVEAAGVSGTVEEINIFTTHLKTPDNKAVIVPNSKITSENIVNYSAKETRRVDLVFGVGYGDDVAKVREILQQVVEADDRIFKDPEPFIVVNELGASSVDFAVKVWTKTDDYWSVYFDLKEKVKLAFDDNGITIPFPQRDVHVYQVE